MIPLLRTAKFASSVLRSNFTRLDHPLKLSWAVTYRCNLQCAMCNIWKRRDSAPELTEDDADRFFRRAGRFSWVGLTGGEPFLRRDLEGLVSRVVARSKFLAAVHVNTNGQDGERVTGFAEWFRGRFPAVRLIVTVSVDGAPAVHDRIRGREGAWARAAATFGGLKRIRGVKAQVGFTLSEHNLDGYGDAVAALRDVWPALEDDDVNVNVFQRSAVYYDNADLPPPDVGALADAAERILAVQGGRRSLNNHLRTTYLRYYRRFAETGRSPLRCQAFSASCFLDPFGNLYPCIVYDRRFLNVRDMDEDLETVWRAPEGKRIRGECARQECPSCWTPCDAFSAIAGSLGRTLLS